VTKWGGGLVFVIEALVGETVGVTETEPAAGSSGLSARSQPVERRTRKLRRFRALRPVVSVAQ
jgi:hypothetical protein